MNSMIPLADRFSELAAGAEQGAINLGIALLVLAIGWVVARLLQLLVGALLRALRFNQWVRRTSGWSVFESGMEASSVVAGFAFWAAIVVAILMALDAVGIPVRVAVGARLAEVLPRVVVASFVALVGSLSAFAVGILVRSAFHGIGAGRAGLAGQLAGAAVLVLTGMLALEQLGLAAQLLVGIGLVAVAAVGLALGLAFGLGCKDLARDLLVEYLRSLEEEAPRRRTGTGPEAL